MSTALKTVLHRCVWLKSPHCSGRRAEGGEGRSQLSSLHPQEAPGHSGDGDQVLEKVLLQVGLMSVSASLLTQDPCSTLLRPKAALCMVGVDHLEINLKPSKLPGCTRFLALDFPGGPGAKNSPADAEDTGSVPGPGKIPTFGGAFGSYACQFLSPVQS